MESRRHHILATYRVWAATSIVSSILLVRFAPQFSIRQSISRTATIIFLAQWLVYGVYAMILYPRYFSPLRNLPSPTGGTHFMGQWFTLIKDPSGIPMRKWAEEIPNDGLIRYLHLFNRERILLTSPKALAEVLNNKCYDFVKPEFLRSGIGQLLGMGIIFAEGDDHKVQRKNLMPAFNFRHVKELYPIFWSKSREMIHGIEKQLLENAPNNSVETSDWASRATLDIIGVAGMGQDFDALQNPHSEMNSIYRHIFSPNRTAQILGLMQFFLPHFIVRSLPLKRNDDVHAACKFARNTSRRLVQEKKALMAANKSLSPDIISVALESGAFTEDNLVDNMMTFLAAGHETTASAFSWAVYLLSRHPEIQKRLRQEIHQHIHSLSSSKVTNETIDNMPYLHAVCNEVLRIYSPVPLTVRDTANDTTILGTVIPRGTTIIICPWATNYSTELWGPDAATFNPDRWMAPGQANAGGAVSNYAFLTFLHGPRSCIGQKFAVGELACLVAAFVGRWEFVMTDPDEVIEVKGGITARPRNGMRVNLTNVGVEGWDS